MKLKTAVIPAFAASLLLFGCSNDEVKDPPEDAPKENESANNDTSNDSMTDTSQDNKFAFTSFDLDVDYADHQDYEVDYDNDEDGMEASFQDDINDEKLSGDKAMDKITPMLEKLDFDKVTPDEEVMKQVKDTFSLKDDYEKFELEVTFPDGTEKEYKDMKQ
ncbi:YusW family protein [Rossellomorea marisflavi]|uniref:YusW family protein n=1 Tax=Rossellomorea marisflavi TaxID=189381 RepID=UPI003ADE91F5